MKKIYIVVVAVAVALFCGCNSSTVKINGKFLGLNAKMVYLEKVTAGVSSVIDSVAIAADGSYKFRVEGVESSPMLYNILYSAERIPILIKGGDHITTSCIGAVLANYTVSGSKETELLREFNNDYVIGIQSLNAALKEYGLAETIEQKSEKARLYNKTYRDVKRRQITFIIEHKESIAAIYALYQRFNGENCLVSPETDIIYYRTVADAVADVYPSSPFLLSLRNDIARMDARRTLINTITERTYPDIVAEDMYGNKQRLSDFEGNVILVDFWSAELGNSNALNADLKQLYKTYHHHGFEVYQVSGDRSKAAWITAVQEQQLPWISVCDFCGERSPILGFYNVHSLPANFLIDQNGTIVAQNIYGKQLEEKVAQLTSAK